MSSFSKTAIALCALSCADVRFLGSKPTAQGLEMKMQADRAFLSSATEQAQIGYGKQINPAFPQCVGEKSMEPDVCVAPWVFCIDVVCDQTSSIVDGVKASKCKCWKQKSSYSILSLSTGGAPCVMGYEGGKSMCKDMQDGQLISTFRSQNTSYLSPSSRAVCPSGTGFAYCWGAKCNEVKNEATGEEEVICDCPILTGNGDVTIEAAQCGDADP